MAKSKNKKSSKKQILSTVVFIVVLLIICLLYYYFAPEINNYLNIGKNSDSLNNSGSTSTATSITYVEGSIQRDLAVHIVDVGQGDAIIIEFPDGSNMLIDAGDNSNTNNNKLVSYIDSLGITTFHYLLATHQDADHVGGMDVIFEKYTVKYVFRPYVLSEYAKASTLPENFNAGMLEKDGGDTSTSLTYYEFLECIVNENSSWSFFNREDDFTLVLDDGNNNKVDCVFDFLTPYNDIENVGYEDPNDYSPLTLLTYAGKSILLTGDAEIEAESEFVSKYEDSEIDVDILKVGHHGSGTSTSQALIDMIEPEIALISCGEGNSYFHPHQGTLDRLSQYGSTIYRTDLQGTIKVTINLSGEMNITTTKAFNDNLAILTAPPKSSNTAFAMTEFGKSYADLLV